MKKLIPLTMLLLLSSCATMNDSLQLGAGIGIVSGAAATYAGYSAGGDTPQFQTVAVGAAIGAAVGLFTSYFTHRKLQTDYQSSQTEQVETHFGDLPPSPFIVPKMWQKKGGN